MSGVTGAMSAEQGSVSARLPAREIRSLMRLSGLSRVESLMGRLIRPRTDMMLIVASRIVSLTPP